MKEIPLTRGKVALIDDEDYESVTRFKWSYHKPVRPTATGYAFRSQKTQGHCKKIYLHRFLLDAPKGMEVDHEDGDGLNCQRHNLRLATSSQNGHNTGPRKNNRCGFKGVRAYKGKWTARIRINNMEEQIGTFESPEAAAHAYDARAIEAFGEFAGPNFPCRRAKQENRENPNVVKTDG